MYSNINIWAVIAAGLSSFVLGGIWYSRLLFGLTWGKAAGIDCTDTNKKHKPLVFVIAIILSIIAAYAFAIFLGTAPSLKNAVIWGLIVGACFVATSFAINYLFAERSFKLILIDGGYHIFQFVLYGVVLGLWH